MEIADLASVSVALMFRQGYWGQQWAHYLDDYKYLTGLLLTGEEPPVESKRVTLGQSTDGLGPPVAHVSEHPRCHLLRQHFWEKADQMFSLVGGKDVRRGVPPSATRNLGTTRTLERVTNVVGRSHTVKNLYVSDSSLFTGSGAENPTLTLVALALRQADHVLRQVL